MYIFLIRLGFGWVYAFSFALLFVCVCVLLFFVFCFFVFQHCVAHRILVSQARIEAWPSAVKGQSPKCCTAREFP